MNFCSNCGSNNLAFRIPPGDHRHRFICNNCETIHYSNPNMVVGCLVLHNDKILLAKRGIEPRKDFWNLPCGFLENDETVEEGALREVKEETGLDVELGELFVVYSLTKSNQIYLIFLAQARNTNFSLNEESIEIKFFAKEEIPWDDIAFSSNTFALEKFLESDGQNFTVSLGRYP